MSDLSADFMRRVRELRDSDAVRELVDEAPPMRPDHPILDLLRATNAPVGHRTGEAA